MRRIFIVLVLGLAGCYASEKMGKDIQDTSHDVNQGGIHMQNGALGVRRPPPTTTITSAPLTITPATNAAPMAAPPVATPPVAAPPATAADAGPISM
jgi:predicted small secreted protein